MAQAEIGLIGLAVMGENLVLNMAHHGFPVVVYNRTVSKVDQFLQSRAQNLPITGAHSLQEFVAQLTRPRRVMMMVKAGSAVDELIGQLVLFLEPGDVLIDGGNSFYKDTERRVREAETRGILYLGVGISGGEEGALKGPSIMPGGAAAAWPLVQRIFQTIAAHVNGEPCCDWIGPGGAGHFVKMVHNGIEYGDMQLIAEAYGLLRDVLGMQPPELHELFARWNETELQSYLIEITSKIFTVRDSSSGEFLVDRILDAAGQKGTGQWTGQAALDFGVPLSLITEAVFARAMSALKEERATASRLLKGPQPRYRGSRERFVEDLRQALYAAKICSYAQGFALMQTADRVSGWALRLGTIARLWRGGCIIRAKFLDYIAEAFDRQPNLANLLLDPYFRRAVRRAQGGWRRIVREGVRAGVAVPALSAALAYYDSYRAARSPANLIQAQRDFFGAHTFERVDRPRNEFFHASWT